MKKITFLTLFLLTGFSILLHAQSNNPEQRLIGSWLSDIDGTTWTFNTDGNMTGKFITNAYDRIFNFIRFSVADKKIILFTADSKYNRWHGEYFFSNDSRTLIIIFRVGVTEECISFRKVS